MKCNTHYATISTDAVYVLPARKIMSPHDHLFTTESKIFYIVDRIHHTGLDGIPAWLLYLARVKYYNLCFQKKSRNITTFGQDLMTLSSLPNE